MLILVAGCSGEVDEHHRGTLESGDKVMRDDNSFYDAYTFKTKEGFAIEVSMTSNEFDTYLILADPNDAKIGEDDDSNGTNASLSLTAPISGSYTVVANSKTSGMTGAYELRISARDPSADK